MKVCLTYLLLILAFKSLSQHPAPWTDMSKLQPDSQLVFEHFDDIQVFQYLNNDSNSIKLTHSKRINSEKVVFQEYFYGYKPHKRITKMISALVYNYDDKGQLSSMVTQMKDHPDGNVIELTYYYYEDTLLIRQETFEFTRDLKDKTRERLKKSGGGIVFAEDYKSERSWKIYETKSFEYDSLGRKIFESIPNSQDGVDSIRFLYNENGQLFKRNTSEYIEEFKYEGSKTYYLCKSDENDLEPDKKIYEYDLNGNLIQETYLTSSEISKDVYEYDDDGNLISFDVYDLDGNIILTHIYKYKKKKK